MSDVRLINLRDLVRRYFDGSPGVRAGAAWLEAHRGDGPFLDRVLRDHRKEAIVDQAEIRARDNLDELLDFYSLLELASLARFVPRELPADLRRRAEADLTVPAVERYVTRIYPLRLPRLLLERLGGRDLGVADPDAAQPAFVQFLSLTNELYDDEDARVFLQLLDDYVFGWTDLSDVLADPRRFLAHAETVPERQTILDHGVHGYRRFLVFSWQFDQFLQELDDLPLLQSAAWHYHGYWFDNFQERIGTAVRSSVDGILGQADDTVDAADVARARAGAAELLAALERLFGDRYRTALPDPGARP